MDVTIIIVNWNVCELFKKCLESIFAMTKEVDYEVIVVDNASYDGSMQMLNSLIGEYKNFQVIFNNTNLGFAVANNEGLHLARGRYIFFINPDMEFTENTVKILYDYMEQHLEISTCTTQLRRANGERQPNIKRNPTYFSQCWLLYKLHYFWQPKFFKKYLAKDFDYTREQEVEQIMGAAVFIRAEVIKELGGWSQDYFLWWEDVDLCKRLQLTGEKIFYTPISHIIHHEGRSFFQQMSVKRQKMFNRGMRIYFKKYHNSLVWFLIVLSSLDSLALAWFAQILRIKPKTQSKL